MIITPEKALDAVTGGDATLEGLTVTDSLGFRAVILTNHKHERVDHVEANGVDEPTEIEWIAEALKKPLFTPSFDVDEDIHSWLGAQPVVRGAAPQAICDELGADRAWRIHNIPNGHQAIEAYVADDAQGYHVYIVEARS